MVWQLMQFNAAAVIPWNVCFSVVDSGTIGIVAMKKILDPPVQGNSYCKIQLLYFLSSNQKFNRVLWKK